MSRTPSYLLALESGEPADPAAFVTAVPAWHVGDTLFASSGQMFRNPGDRARDGAPSLLVQPICLPSVGRARRRTARKMSMAEGSARSAPSAASASCDSASVSS